MNISNISSQITQNIFSKLDTENQGYLSQEVLSSAFGTLNSGAADEDAEALVSSIDTDSDGQITKSELSKGVENLLSQLSGSQQRPPMHAGGMPPPPPPGHGEKGSDELGEGVSVEQAAEIAAATDDERLSEIMTQISENFDEVDTDEDGIVSREEGMAFHEAQREASFAEANNGFDLSAMQNVAKLIAAYGFDLSEADTTMSTTA